MQPKETISRQTMAVLADVLNERMKQVAKGYTADHDDAHNSAELADAGAAMAMQASDRLNSELHGYAPEDKAADSWPEMWGPMPEKPVREALVISIALLVAEVERVDRLKADGEIVFCDCGHVADADEAVDCEDAMLCQACSLQDPSLESDPIRNFLQDRCEFNADAEESAEDFYAAFSAWLESEQEAGREKGRCMSAMAFGESLKIWRGLIKRIQKEGAVVYRGIEICEEFRAAGGDAA